MIRTADEKKAIIEGIAVDSETGEPIFAAPIKILDEAGNNVVAETSTDMNGEFRVVVPVGRRYQVLMFGQIYQPVQAKILDDEGRFTPVTEEGRRIRIESVKVTLSEIVAKA